MISFERYKVVEDTLIPYGFIKKDNIYYYSTNIMNNTFKIVITIKNNEVSGKIIELELNEEYINHKINKMQGKFVTQIRDTYNQVLLDIRNHCFIKETFLFPQANRLTKYIYETYDNEPEFPWTRYPYDALFRNSNTKQWYCLIINRNDKEIINLKLPSHDIKHLLTCHGYYPAIYLNEKYWISIILDDTLTDEEIIKIIDISYQLSS